MEREISLRGDGDFRSDECIELLKQADIVVTNPPFSLFREYLAQLIQYGKKFIILGNLTSIGYRGTFSLFQDNKVWLGSSITSGVCWFGVPDYYPIEAASSKTENSKNFIKVKGVRWYTNLEHEKRKEELKLSKKYNPIDHPRYDNYDAIEVSKVKDIPVDYEGVMGVPVTFLDKHNPQQFEIVGNPRNDPNAAFKIKTYTKEDKRLLADGKDINGTATVRMANGKLQLKFSRVLIRRHGVAKQN